MYSDYSKAYEDESSPKNIYSYDLKDTTDLTKIMGLFPIVIVDAWAEWCEPCKKVSKLYEKLAERFLDEHQNRLVIFVKDNIDNPDSYHVDKVQSIPTIFVYVNKELVFRSDGYEEEKIESLLRRWLEKK
jgi:thiol-disulfide isomerase/thioredoxin